MGGCSNIGKSSWPELLHTKGEDARVTIQEQNPQVHAIIVQEGSSVVQNFDCHRVWVWVDKDGIVAQIPKAG